MKRIAKILFFGFSLVFISLWLSQIFLVKGQIPQYDLYLPLVNKDRGQTVFGVEVNYLSSLIANRAKDANVTWVRLNALLWSDIQPSETEPYQWQNATRLEAYLQNAYHRKLQTILIVRSTPTWAQKVPGYFCGPIKQEKFAAFAQFMYDVVKRYSLPPYNVLYYELWNEPDVAPNLVSQDSVFGCWGDNRDYNYGGWYYAEMLRVVYPAIKSANPNAQVVVGGLLLDCDPRSFGAGYCPRGQDDPEQYRRPPRFIQGIIQSGGANYFDYISFHGYPQYNPDYSPIEREKSYSSWSVNGGVVAGKINYLRSLTNKPLLHTEGGLIWANNNYVIDPNDDYQKAKADYVVWLYARNWALDVKGTTWYTLNGPGWRNGGLLDGSQNPLPAYYALKYMTETLNDYKYSKEISPGNGTFGFEFVKGTSKIWIVFSPDKNPRTIPLPSGFVSAANPLGEAVSPVGNNITITRPTYLFIGP